MRAVCNECKIEIDENPMYKDFGIVVVCNHKVNEEVEVKK